MARGPQSGSAQHQAVPPVPIHGPETSCAGGPEQAASPPNRFGEVNIATSDHKVWCLVSGVCLVSVQHPLIKPYDHLFTVEAFMPDVLISDAMKQLLTKVEEATRSTEEGVKYFVEPASGTLRRASNRRHHIIFGRRGSGKSSLLRKAAADLTVNRRPIAQVDLEAFKGHSYPDLLLSVLIATFESFHHWLGTAAIQPKNRTSFWMRLFGRKPTTSAYDKAKCQVLVTQIHNYIVDLKRQLHHADEAEIELRDSLSRKLEIHSEDSLNVKVSPIAVGIKENDKNSFSAEFRVQERFKREKVDYLRRHVMDYQAIFDEMGRISAGDSFLFLDDLYHIRRDDQAHVVDYLHSIAKGHRLWLKIGTIRHRSNWYAHGSPPVGMKLGDDADDIDLDLTLEKYALAKEFLHKILENYASDVTLNIESFLTDGAFDRLVLASGGVARDFLTIFRKSVDVARENGVEKITAEEINVAAGEHDTVKRDELKRDTYNEDELSLDQVFNQIRSFCLDTAGANCFLVDKEAKGDRVDAIHELVDLKLLHLVRSRVTVSKKQGKLFEAYMLDLSQYAGARAKRGLTIIEFWKKDSKEKLRKVSLIFDTNTGQAEPGASADGGSDSNSS